MIDGNKILGLIPARGGSKGIPRKNLIDVAGRPLIAYTIDAAKESQYLDKVVVSSEDDEILEISENLGAEILRRPMALAQDETPGIEPVLHAVDCLPGFDFVVLLQPTSPLRSVDDIDGALELCVRERVPSCVSVRLASESPYWMYNLIEKSKLKPLLVGKVPARRQELPAAYILNGAVYIADIVWLRKSLSFLTKETIAFIMPPDRSLDIDTKEDLNRFIKLHHEN